MAERVQVDLIVKAVSQGFAGVRQDIEALGKASQASSDGGVKSLNQTLGNLVNTIGRVQAGAVVVGGVFQKAFELGKEGAAIQRTEMQLDRLAATIDTTADSILGKLGEATRGLVSQAEMASSAAQIIGLGLGKTEDDVVRLATVVGRLGLDMQQVILTFANNSIMRLDALGLSVDDVRVRAEKFAAQGFDANKAFDMAVLTALEARLDTLGGSVEDNAAIFQRFETQVADLTNAFKVWLAEGWSPVLAALGGTNARQFDNLVESHRQAARSLEDYINVGRKLSDVGGIWLGLGVVLSGNDEAHHNALVRIAQDMAIASDSFAEFERAFKEAFNLNARYSIMGLSGDLEGFYENLLQLEDATTAFNNAYRPATSRAAVATQELADSAEGVGIAIRDSTGVVVGWVGMMDELDRGVSTVALDARELAGATYEVKTATDKSLPPVYAAWEDILAIMAKRVEAHQQMRAEFNADITAYLSGTKAAQLYTATIEELAANGEMAVFSSQALRQALLEQAAEAGVSTYQMQLLMAATGAYSDEQIRAALNAAAMQEKIAGLAAMIADGTLTVESAIQRLDSFAKALSQPLGIYIETGPLSNAVSLLDTLIARYQTAASLAGAIDAGELGGGGSPIESIPSGSMGGGSGCGDGSSGSGGGGNILCAWGMGGGGYSWSRQCTYRCHAR